MAFLLNRELKGQGSSSLRRGSELRGQKARSVALASIAAFLIAARACGGVVASLSENISMSTTVATATYLGDEGVLPGYTISTLWRFNVDSVDWIYEVRRSSGRSIVHQEPGTEIAVIGPKDLAFEVGGTYELFIAETILLDAAAEVFEGPVWRFDLAIDLLDFEVQSRTGVPQAELDAVLMAGEGRQDLPLALTELTEELNNYADDRALGLLGGGAPLGDAGPRAARVYATTS